jgi:group I intron endonuclease
MTAIGILQPEKPHGFLYRLTFPNGKAYIGITTKSVEKRFIQHCSLARIGRVSFAVHLAISKYDSKNVVVETLATADVELLKRLEIEEIDKQNTRYPNGYNLTDGGDGAVGMDAETRRKISNAASGRTATPETKAKLSAAHTGKKYSPEMCARMSVISTGRCHTEDAKLKISEKAKARWADPDKKEKLSASLRGKRYSEQAKESIRASRIAYLLNNPAATVSEATKRKISESHLARNLTVPKRVASEKTKATQSEKAKAKWDDPEWREKTLKSRLEKRLQKA